MDFTFTNKAMQAMAGFAIQLNKNRWVCYVPVMILGTFMPLQSGSWNQFVCLYACNSWRTAECISHEILYGTVHERFFQGIWFSVLTIHMQWPLDTKTSCISADVSNYIPVLHMQSAVILNVCIRGACHTFHAYTCYKNEVSLYHFNSMFQNWKFCVPDRLTCFVSYLRYYNGV